MTEVPLAVNALFYVLGVAGGVWALVFSALGLRRDAFRKPWHGNAALALFVVLLGGALGFLWTSKEEEESGAAESATETRGKPGGASIEVSETEYSIRLGGSAAKPGKVTLVARNEGQIPHDLAVEGSGADDKTPVFQPGESEKLTVELERGEYTLYCSVGDHRQRGMETRLKVG